MHKTLHHVCFKESTNNVALYDLETNTKQWNQLLVAQPTRLDGYTKLTISSLVPKGK